MFLFQRGTGERGKSSFNLSVSSKYQLGSSCLLPAWEVWEEGGEGEKAETATFGKAGPAGLSLPTPAPCKPRCSAWQLFPVGRRVGGTPQTGQKPTGC